MTTTVNQPSFNDRPFVQPQCFSMFCTTQEHSHKIDSEALAAVNTLLLYLSWLTIENEELKTRLKELEEKQKA